MMHNRLFGAIADDYTGAADLAGMLSSRGVRTALLLGLQPDEVAAGLDPAYEGVVVALKSRSMPAPEACRQSLCALEQLRRLRVRQVQFKYCSTFDSTAEGNIGPVTEALMDALGMDFTVAVPALPVNGRTQYLGHLFVGERLLSETHMRHHPVTPMTDANLVRHLQQQTVHPIGLVALPVVREGAVHIRAEMERLRAEGIRIALVDVVTDEDLAHVADASADLRFLTGGSGLGMTLPDVWRRRNLLRGDNAQQAPLAPPSGGTLLLAGSCSAVTLEQLRILQEQAGPGLKLDVLRLLSAEFDEVDRLLREVSARIERRGWALVYSSADEEERSRVLEAALRRGLSNDDVRTRIEHVTAEIARRVVDAPLATRLIVAGGETTGAVTEALGLQTLEIGDLLDPGVPVACSIGPRKLGLVFKSGNFGSPDFFLKALRHFGVNPAPQRVTTAPSTTHGYTSSDQPL